MSLLTHWGCLDALKANSTMIFKTSTAKKLQSAPSEIFQNNYHLPIFQLPDEHVFSDKQTCAESI